MKKFILIFFLLTFSSFKIDGELGSIKLGVRINDKWQVEGQYVQNSDEVEIGIMNPKSQKYQTSLETEFFTNEFKLFEKGCFGGTPEWEVKGDTIRFPVKIPVKDLVVDYGGHFYIQIGDLFLKNNYEMILPIKMPYKNKFIGFDKVR